MPPKVVNKPRSHSVKGKDGGVNTSTAARTAADKSGIASKGSGSDMENYFDKLKSIEKVDADNIGGKAFAQLLNDVKISTGTLEFYVLMWRLGVTRQGILSRAEWVTAAYTYAFDTLTQLKTKVGEWTSEVKSKKEVFAIMYNFLYDYVRGEEDRIASTESAVAAWGVLFPGDPLMLSWNKWAKEVYAEQVSRDLWRQVLLFKNAYEENREFPVDKPWPSAIIDFCTWHKAQKG